MIAFDFEYYHPTTPTEAIEAFQNLQNAGKSVCYVSGGTEFITRARMNQVTVDAIIDLKGISDCHQLGLWQQQIVIGSAVTLNQVTQANLFPLLGETVRRIADHTSRNKITFGGNIASQLPYREGALPLLVSEAQVKIAGPGGERITPFADVFLRELRLAPGEFISQFVIDASYAKMPYASMKRTRQTQVDYPVVTVVALKKDERVRVGFSGICDFPFRDEAMENVLNTNEQSVEERIDQAIGLLPSPVAQNIQASAEYRLFVLRALLRTALETLMF